MRNETKAAPKKTAKTVKMKEGSEGMIAVVRVRSSMRRSEAQDYAIKLLNLHKQNYCVLVPNTPSIRGMVMKVKDFVTWGPATEDTISALSKMAEPHPRKEGEQKPYFRLQPPLKGYGRKGIKKAFNIKGALGDRGDAINDLIKRMIR